MTERLDEIAGMLKAHGAILMSPTPEPSARVRADLLLDGDKAATFISAYAARYQIDMTGFSRRRFFRSYPENIGLPVLDLTWLLRLLNKDFDRAWRNAPTYEISIAHLMEVADRGVWFDPAPTPHSSNRVTDDPANPVTRRMVDWAWFIVTLPWRLLSLFFAILGLAMLGYGLWFAANAMLEGNWPRMFEAVISLSLPFLILATIAMRTAEQIERRFGDQDPRDLI